MPNNAAQEKKKKIIVFASPKCTVAPMLYKPYFNVAWFVQAYADLLTDYTILTTQETMEAVTKALDEDRHYEGLRADYWRIPTGSNTLQSALRGSRGFDGQVELVAAVARREVERVLMFMDPLDTKEYLPETYAFIRNCTLADVGLHINLGATYWAESVTSRSARKQAQNFGGWRTDEEHCHRLNPERQTIYFIAHDNEKEKMARFVSHYHEVLAKLQAAGCALKGTSGTCARINAYLRECIAPFVASPCFEAEGTVATGHGPTGGDVLIADQICRKWPLKEEGDAVTPTNLVREKELTHTVIFFIDYQHARPHETDIHVLLRACLNPYRGVHLILNQRTAIEWGETLRNGYLSKVKASGNGTGEAL